jgi:hypothetical protein
MKDAFQEFGEYSTYVLYGHESHARLQFKKRQCGQQSE